MKTLRRLFRRLFRRRKPVNVITSARGMTNPAVRASRDVC